ncbi:MAG: HEPN domain-containing protein [Candidatus Latescibacteria bacterium]|nr:HEPN domain-containing protein [Candidatus Latescibacterota bacterium]
MRYWWAQAHASLASARRELEAGVPTFAINRLYYAAFYGVSAALLDRQKAFRKHTGVRAAFHREFMKTGLLDVEWGKFYDQLFEDRHEGDYIALMTFDSAYVEQQLTRCTQFLERLRPLIASLADGHSP